jgi:hypothetical protein
MREMSCLSKKKTANNNVNAVTRKQRSGIPQWKKSPAEQILFLQRTIGNRAVQRLLTARRKPGNNGHGISRYPFSCDEKTPFTKTVHRDKSNYPFGQVNRFPEAYKIEVSDDKLYQGSGVTTCNTSTGTPTTSVTEHCAGTCVQEHEDIHVNDISACCANYANCVSSGGANCATRWRTWVNSIRDWTECNAYTREETCLTSLISSGCGTEGTISASCCNTLRSELAIATTRKNNHCPGSTHACPF